MLELTLQSSLGEPGVENGFLGEIAAVDFITGDALADILGITAGTSQFSDAGWLLFKDPFDGATKYIAKKTIRYSISWMNLYEASAVYGDRTIEVNGNLYRIRLLTGANADPFTGANGNDTPNTHGSEWNRLFYRLIPNPITNLTNPSNEGIELGEWGSYTENELQIRADSGTYGAYTWCQETNGDSRATRGHGGVAYLYPASATWRGSAAGWRPVLELVE